MIRDADEKWVESVNLAKGVAVFNDGTTCPIDRMFDQFGDDCGPNEAVVAVCGPDNGLWYSVDLSGFEAVSMH